MAVVFFQTRDGGIKASGREQQTKCSFDFKLEQLNCLLKRCLLFVSVTWPKVTRFYTQEKIKLEWCEALWERVDLNTCFNRGEIMIGR